MKDEDKRGIFSQVIEILDTDCEACLALLDACERASDDGVKRLTGDLSATLDAVEGSMEFFKEKLEHAYIPQLLDNVRDTLGGIVSAYQSGDFEKSADLTEFQLFPFTRHLRESFYFWAGVYGDSERMKRYYADEFAPCYSNPYAQSGEPLPFRLSIAIPVYNHLDVTRRCIEQLFKVTDFEKLNAELILLDHGSSDGTWEYFKSLNVRKAIHFKSNHRMYVFATMFQVCQGEYLCFLSNDVLVTQNWAELLMRCMDSDPSIIAAVPRTPNISNLQGLGLPDKNPKEFVAWANRNNAHDPSKWSDRVRLMPPLGMYRTSAVNQIGFADPMFYSMEFWDDDFSLRARRAGYRQILCGDVACYHYGSVTGKEGQVKENTLEYGRKLFLNKNGIDPWGPGMCYDYNAVQPLARIRGGTGEVNALCVDCGIGDTPLQIRNIFRQSGRVCRLYNLTSQRAFVPDLKPLSDGFAYGADIAAEMREQWKGTAFDIIYMGRNLAEYENLDEIFESVRARLKPNGVFICFCENPYCAATLAPLLRFSLSTWQERLCLMEPSAAQEKLSACFASVQRHNAIQPFDGLNAFAAQYFKTGNRSAVLEQLQFQRAYFFSFPS